MVHLRERRNTVALCDEKRHKTNEPVNKRCSDGTVALVYYVNNIDLQPSTAE